MTGKERKRLQREYPEAYRIAEETERSGKLMQSTETEKREFIRLVPPTRINRAVLGSWASSAAFILINLGVLVLIAITGKLLQDGHL